MLCGREPPLLQSWFKHLRVSTKSTTLSKDKRNHCGKALFCVRLATQDDPP